MGSSLEEGCPIGGHLQEGHRQMATAKTFYRRSLVASRAPSLQAQLFWQRNDATTLIATDKVVVVVAPLATIHAPSSRCPSASSLTPAVGSSQGRVSQPSLGANTIPPNRRGEE